MDPQQARCKLDKRQLTVWRAAMTAAQYGTYGVVSVRRHSGGELDNYTDEYISVLLSYWGMDNKGKLNRGTPENLHFSKVSTR